MLDKEYILCAAIWYKIDIKLEHQPWNIDKGVVLCGYRHCAINIQYTLIYPHYVKDRVHTIQGFLTSTGRFVDRTEAANIAYMSKQITEPKSRLFSEDLYRRDLNAK